MELKDQLCSFEQSVKLSMLISEPLKKWRNTLFYYFEDSDQIVYGEDFMSHQMIYYPAYTVAELMEMLPRSIVKPDDHGLFPDRWHLWIRRSGHPGYVAIYCENYKPGGLHSAGNKTLAETLSDMLIWLIDNNHINLKDLK